jgi:hypothetical protein
MSSSKGFMSGKSFATSTMFFNHNQSTIGANNNPSTFIDTKTTFYNFSKKKSGNLKGNSQEKIQ